MNNLTDLFTLLEVTRAQPQYGYALSGLKQHELSNLAEHHYLVTVIAWQLALMVQKQGAAINVQKVLEFTLIHDLGELFGGDIGMPYAKANPKARELAKAFEAENQNFLAQFFGEQKSRYLKLSQEIMDAKSDEAIIAKIADYMEVTHYKAYVNLFSQADLDLIEPKLEAMMIKMKDAVAKTALAAFLKEWLNHVAKKSPREIVTGSAS